MNITAAVLEICAFCLYGAFYGWSAGVLVFLMIFANNLMLQEIRKKENHNRISMAFRLNCDKFK